MFFFEILLLLFLSVCPSVRLSVNKKVHTCIVRETWKILWKYQKFFEKNQLGPSVCLLVIKKVHTCFEKTVQNREKCLFFFSNQIFFVKLLKTTTRCATIYSKKYHTSFRITVRLKNVSLRILEKVLKFCYVNVHWTSDICLLYIALF